MKKITLFTVFMFFTGFGFLNAQTQQGNVLIGVSSTLSVAGTGSDLMNIGFSSIKYKSDADDFEESDPDKRTSINFLPKVGYFVADNLVLGLGLNVAISTEKSGKVDYNYSQQLLSAEPFIRYYIPTPKVLPFFEISGSYGAVKSKSDYGDDFNIDDWDHKSSVMSIGGGIGLAAPLGERVTFDVLAGYNSLTVKDKEDNDDNERSVMGTLGLKIGFTILLGAN